MRTFLHIFDINKQFGLPSIQEVAERRTLGCIRFTHGTAGASTSTVTPNPQSATRPPPDPRVVNLPAMNRDQQQQSDDDDEEEDDGEHDGQERRNLVMLRNDDPMVRVMNALLEILSKQSITLSF